MHYGGYDAAVALWGDCDHEVKIQAEEAERHDSSRRRRRLDVAQKNAKIDRDNAARLDWNTVHPTDERKSLQERMPEPPGVLIESD